MMFKKEWQKLLVLIILSLVLFTLKIGSTPILDGDTAFWGKIAKNMLATSDWLTPRFIHPESIIDRPPLMPWLMAASFKIFGVNEFAISFWHSLMALGCVLITYFMGKELFTKKTGFISALILLTTAQFFYQGRSPLQDMPLTFFLASAFYCFILFEKRKNYLFYYFIPVFLGLATLTKGPVGLVLFGLAIFIYLWVEKKFLKYLNLHLLGASVLFLLIALPWYLAEYRILGTPFLQVILKGNVGRFFFPVDAVGKAAVIEPQYNFYSYVLQLFLLAVPWSGFLYPAIYNSFKKKSFLLFIWAAVVVLFFSLSLNHKIARYILPAFPAFSLMIGKLWNDFLENNKEWKIMLFSDWLNVLLVVPLLFLGTLYLILNFPAEQAAYQPIVLPLLIILSSGMLLSSLILFFRKAPAAFVSFVLTALIGYLVLIPLTDIYFKEANPTKYFSLKINQLAKPGDQVVKYQGGEDHLMIFYLNSIPATIGDRMELIKLMKKQRVWAVTEDPRAVEGLKYPVNIIERKNNFVLFTNR